MEQNRVKKYLKGSKGVIIGLIISVIVIALAVGSIISKNAEAEQKQLELEANAKEFLELEMNSESIDDLIAKDTYIQVQTVTDYFASKGEEKYYFVSDGAYIYVAQIDEKNFEKLKEIYEYTYDEDVNAQAPERVKIYGVTSKIQSDLAEIIISEYNTMMGQELLTEENWADYVGAVYLKMPEIEVDTELEMLLIIFAGVFAVIFLCVYICSKVSSKKTLKKYSENDELEKILDEIEDENSLKYFKNKVFLTKSYYVDLSKGFNVYKYEDIKWIYVHQLVQYIFFYTKTIMLKEAGNKKVKQTASAFAMLGKNDEFQRLFNDLCQRVPNALKGYTTENIQAAKDL